MEHITINRKLLITSLVLAMMFVFSSCGGSNSNDSSETTSSTAIVTEYDTVVYTFEDNDIPEDLYSMTVTVEYDGDKVMKVTEVNVDDMSAEEDEDFLQMRMTDCDGYLNDTGFKNMDGFSWDVSVDGKVRTETRIFDMSTFDTSIYKKYVEIKSDKDYVSLEDLTAAFEAAGYSKVE